MYIRISTYSSIRLPQQQQQPSNPSYEPKKPNNPQQKTHKYNSLAQVPNLDWPTTDKVDPNLQKLLKLNPLPTFVVNNTEHVLPKQGTSWKFLVILNMDQDNFRSQLLTFL